MGELVKNVVELEEPKEDIIELEEKSVEKSNSEVDYLKLIASQNEAARRLKIAGIRNKVNDLEAENTKLNIASAVFTVGVIAATAFSGIDTDKAIQLEIESFNSLDALKQYLGMVTPAMYATVALAVSSFFKLFENRGKLNQARKELDDIESIVPTDYMDEVEIQAKK